MNNIECKVELKPVKDLLGLNFFIPNYQRGYKWTEKQVEDLLNDLDEFKSNSTDDFYCLQPLAVKRRNTNLTDKSITIEIGSHSEEEAHKKIRDAYKKDEEWEVIDGQQRLTSIYLLLSYLYKKSDTETQYIYTLSYESRDCTTSFLKNIALNKDDGADENVDSYHISIVYKKIKKWFEGNNKRSEDKYKKEFLEILLDRTRFIWYETTESAIAVFTRLNIGKIGLTNSELIKALILSQPKLDEKSVIRKNEIANEWNEIEQNLQNDEFWYFIHDKDYNKPTRIDFLFDIICVSRKGLGTDQYRTFRFYDRELKKDPTCFDKQWKSVKSLFETLTEWYRDVEFYHYIGFLICLSKDVKYVNTLYSEWMKSNKEGFRDHIIKEIIKTIKDCKDLNKQYEIENEPKTKCKPILLLHNIQTVINQNKQVESDDKFKYSVFYRFPFNLYKTENWDVEHIDSNTTNKLTDNFSKLLWLYQYKDKRDNNHPKYKELYDKIIEYITKNKNSETVETIEEKEIKEKIALFSFEESDWENVVEEIHNEHKSLGENTKTLKNSDKNKIGNFTLLDSSTNRGYGNSIFPRKRLVIMAKDRCLSYKLKLKKNSNTTTWDFIEEEDRENGVSAFIPPVTRNVFMKYYSPHTQSFTTWNSDDFENYKTDIATVLEEFLKLDSEE